MRYGKVVWLSSLAFAIACGARTELESAPGSGGTGTGGVPPIASGGVAGTKTASGGVAGAPVRTRCTLAPDDPRVMGIRPDQIAKLDGADFVEGDVASYRWTLKAEDCDAVVQNAEFILKGVTTQVVHFQPSRPAPYHFTLEVTGRGGDRAACDLEVPVEGVGLRTELCWDTSLTADLDLYLHSPLNQNPWFKPGSTQVVDGLDGTTCNTSNASWELRGQSRVDWGYPDSPLDACNTPSFQGFLGTGRCPNPRAALDNNQSSTTPTTGTTGTTERMQLDSPRDGERFRVMAQNFNNKPAKPRLFVYCSGERAGSFDAPALPPNFQGPSERGFGLMWRIADITTKRDAQGKTRCSASPVLDRPAISFDDPSF
ncbi:MAG TPA: hypothetical protein VG937_33275 [Polyangiaceae bacterium]|nr:hypothetical protein [Polyangiaceae bacterium]